MKLSGSAILFALIGLAAAVPTPDQVETIVARQDEGPKNYLYMCTNANFGGDCYEFYYQSGKCQNFGGDLYNRFNDQVSSLDNRGGYKCDFWEHQNCGGAKWDSKHNNDMSQNTGAWNDRITSFMC